MRVKLSILATKLTNWPIPIPIPIAQYELGSIDLPLPDDFVFIKLSANVSDNGILQAIAQVSALMRVVSVKPAFFSVFASVHNHILCEMAQRFGLAYSQLTAKGDLIPAVGDGKFIPHAHFLSSLIR